ncbi:MAG TPA: EamA family transporter [Candidatus Limiplasma sp.]|nr:EamA family transporter [Candidatus Limiplasma sp.]HPS81106.1 EamA family transporter [Candidatus Limiplasma sp.]
MNSGVVIYLVTPLISAASQLMLKKAADNPRYTGVRFYVNPLVVFAYLLFFGCMVLNIVALQTLDLTVASVLEASGFLYVMVLGRLFLQEKITPKKLIGNALIVAGIAITLTLH